MIMVIENILLRHIVWSEIGSGFGEAGSTPPPKNLTVSIKCITLVTNSIQINNKMVGCCLPLEQQITFRNKEFKIQKMKKVS